MAAASIKEVARLAGVSLGTVSNVLNRPEAVAPQTRKRVLDAIHQLGYVRNDSARHLRAGQSRTVTVTATEERAPVVGAPTTGANPSCQVPVTASVSDESGLASVTLFWSGPSGKGQVAMSGSGRSWSAEIGPVNVGGNITMYVVARDTRGNTATGPSRTIYVNPCPG